MRIAIALALLAPTVALADNFTVAWHQVTIDPRGDTTADETWQVSGTKIVYELKFTGRGSDKPANKPRKVVGKVLDPDALAKAIAALDKVKPAPDAKADPKQTDYTACITRKGKTRCEYARGDADPTPGYKHLSTITELLTAGVPKAE